MESILTSIKLLLGITEDYEYFDTQLITYINSVFSSLRQLGVGPTGGFTITDKSAVWSDYLANQNETELEMVRTYVYLKVRLLFDPPSNSFVVNSVENQIKEYEWRLREAVEVESLKGET